MNYQTVFKRYELKYMITSEQKEKILQTISPYMSLDKYGKTTIRNLYFDTSNYRLIRRSIDKPVYKEKLRIRSYSKAEPDSIVFVELKKKYNSVVYKRRLPMTEQYAIQSLCERKIIDVDSQVAREIEYFVNFYGELHPTVFLSYDREAYYANDASDFRVTFDENILCRQTDLSLGSEVYGEPVLPSNIVIMEIKCSGGIPLWMTSVLSKSHIFKTHFSKYGTAYKQLVFPHIHKNISEQKGE